jgi:hypothetical protein
MVSGFIIWRTKALTPELKWIKVLVGDDFVARGSQSGWVASSVEVKAIF